MANSPAAWTTPEAFDPVSNRKHGQLQEWAKDFEEKEPGHRHMSHMYGLYPGAEITRDKTPEIARPRAYRWNAGCRRGARTRDGVGLGLSISGPALERAIALTNRW